MFLHVVSPAGAYTSIDLIHLPLWRLWLMSKGSMLTLVLSYDTGGTRGDAIVAQVDVVNPDEAKNIAAVGIVDLNKDVSRARLEEAAKVLYNHENTRKEAELIVPKVGKLADIYFGILDAMADGPAADSALNTSIGAMLKGELSGYRFAVTAARFEPWRTGKDTIGLSNAGSVSAGFGLTLAPTAAANPATTSPGGKPPDESQPKPPSLSRENKRNAAAAKAKAAPVNPEPAAPIVSESSDTNATSDPGDAMSDTSEAPLDT